MANDSAAQELADREPQAPRSSSRRDLLKATAWLALLSPNFACEATTDRQDSRPPTENEIDKLPRSEAMAYLLSSYEEQIERVVASVVDALSEEHRAYVHDAKIVYANCCSVAWTRLLRQPQCQIVLGLRGLSCMWMPKARNHTSASPT